MSFPTEIDISDFPHCLKFPNTLSAPKSSIRYRHPCSPDRKDTSPAPISESRIAAENPALCHVRSSGETMAVEGETESVSLPDKAIGSSVLCARKKNIINITAIPTVQKNQNLLLFRREKFLAIQGTERLHLWVVKQNTTLHCLQPRAKPQKRQVR